MAPVRLGTRVRVGVVGCLWMKYGHGNRGNKVAADAATLFFVYVFT